MHHLHRTACQAKCHRPERSLARPVYQIVDATDGILHAVVGGRTREHRLDGIHLGQLQASEMRVLDFNCVRSSGGPRFFSGVAN